MFRLARATKKRLDLLGSAISLSLISKKETSSKESSLVVRVLARDLEEDSSAAYSRVET